MSDTQVKEVVLIAKPQLNEMIGADGIKFNSPSDHYPDALYRTLIFLVKPIALKWIDDNKPMAWFRPMFT